MQNNLMSLYATSPETRNLTEKQLKVLNAAIKLFAKNGYANTSTQQIAKAATVSEGSIFKHFNNKHGLLKAILRPLTDSLLPDILHEFSRKMLLTSYPSLHEFIKTITVNRIQFIEDNILVVKIFLSEVLYDSAVRKDIIGAFPQDFIDDLNNELTQMKAQHVMVDWPNQQIIRFLSANFAGYVVEHYVFFPDRDWDKEAELNNLIRFMENGLSPQEVS